MLHTALHTVLQKSAVGLHFIQCFKSQQWGCTHISKYMQRPCTWLVLDRKGGIKKTSCNKY